MGREINPFGLRMPPELRKLIEKSARLNHRSMNAELVMRLQSSVEQDPVFFPEVSEDGPEYTLTEDQSALIRLYSRMPARRKKVLLKFLQEMERPEAKKK